MNNSEITKVIESIIKSDLKKYEKLSSILKILYVDVCGIDQSKYYILGSFAIRKQRTISDLDINMDEKEFLKLSPLVENNIGVLQIYKGEQIRWFYDMTQWYNELTGLEENDFSIEAFMKKNTEGFPNDRFSLKFLTENDMLEKDENGHQFFSLTTLLEWKKTMNREKDKLDIELIEKLLTKKDSKKKRSTKSKKTYKNISKSKKTYKKRSRKR